MKSSIDFFEDLCFFPPRAVDPHSTEAIQAELWICEYFKQFYKSQYGDTNAFVIFGLSYLTPDTILEGTGRYKGLQDVYNSVESYAEYCLKGIPNSKIFNIILKWLRSDFKNMYPMEKSVVTKMSGGYRKPDVLGIRLSGNQIIMELIEVTTKGEARDTIREDLDSKRRILETLVKPNIEREISDIQLKTGMSLGPSSIEIIYSTWKPNSNQLIAPLLPNLQTGKYEWICYKPTKRYNNGTGQDGLVLYEIHSVGSPDMLPKNVIQKITNEVRKQMKQTTFELTLTPFLNNYWSKNKRDQQQLMTLVAAGMGIALIITVGILLLPEIAVAASAATAYTATTIASLSFDTMVAISAASITLPRMLSIADTVVESSEIKPSFVQ